MHGTRTKAKRLSRNIGWLGTFTALVTLTNEWNCRAIKMTRKISGSLYVILCVFVLQSCFCFCHIWMDSQTVRKHLQQQQWQQSESLLAIQSVCCVLHFRSLISSECARERLYAVVLSIGEPLLGPSYLYEYAKMAKHAQNHRKSLCARALFNAS